MGNPESWYVIEHFIEELGKDKKLKYLTMELQHIVKIKKKDFLTLRSRYFLDYRRMLISTGHYLKQRDFSNARPYFSGFLENETKRGSAPEQIQVIYSENTRAKIRKNDLDKFQGYISSEDFPKSRRSEFLKNTDKLSARKEAIQNEYKLDELKFYSNELIIVQKIIKSCELNDITSIFIKPARRQKSLGLYKQVKVSKIDLSNPVEYPEFYTLLNTFDFSHLNSSGAKLYSLELAKKFGEIIE